MLWREKQILANERYGKFKRSIDTRAARYLELANIWSRRTIAVIDRSMRVAQWYPLIVVVLALGSDKNSSCKRACKMQKRHNSGTLGLASEMLPRITSVRSARIPMEYNRVA